MILTQGLARCFLSLCGIIAINMQNSWKKETLKLGILMKEFKENLNCWGLINIYIKSFRVPERKKSVTHAVIPTSQRGYLYTKILLTQIPHELGLMFAFACFQPTTII